MKLSFCFIYVIQKNHCQINKTKKNLLLQFISHKNCKYKFFLYINQSQLHKSHEK